MARIEMTEALSGALIARCQGEYGQLSVANFALDILLDSANAEIARLRADCNTKDERLATITDRVRLVESQIEDLKRSQDSKRADVMGAADTIKQRKADRGQDPH